MQWWMAVLLLVLLLAAVGVLTRRRSSATERFGPPVDSLDVDTAAGSVEILGEDRADAAVEIHLVRSLYAPGHGHREELVDGTLRCHARWAHPLGHLRVDYRLRVPRQVAVRARSSAGRVTVADLAGRVDVESRTGAVIARRLSGATRLRSRAGTVSGEHLSAAEVNAESAAGDVRLLFVTAPRRIEAHSAAGAVDITLPDEGYRIDARSDAGRVEIGVHVEPGSARAVRARSNAGRVSLRRG